MAVFFSYICIGLLSRKWMAVYLHLINRVKDCFYWTCEGERTLKHSQLQLAEVLKGTMACIGHSDKTYTPLTVMFETPCLSEDDSTYCSKRNRCQIDFKIFLFYVCVSIVCLCLCGAFAHEHRWTQRPEVLYSQKLESGVVVSMSVMSAWVLTWELSSGLLPKQ